MTVIELSIQSGNHFHPHDTAGLRDLVVKRYASYWGIEHEHKRHLFYRQCMLFVAFIQKNHPGEFKNFLVELENGASFKSAFVEAFETDTETKWKEFQDKITSIKSLQGKPGNRGLLKVVPAIVCLDAQGKERTDLRLVVFLLADKFLVRIYDINAPGK